MKKMIYSFIAVVTSICCLCSFTVSAADLVAKDIYDNTIFQPEYRDASLGVAVVSDIIANWVTDSMEEIDAVMNSSRANKVKTSFFNIAGDRLTYYQMPDIEYLCGKTRLKWYTQLNSASENYVDITVQMLFCDGYEYNYTPWIQWEDGWSIPVNCLVYTIKRSSGDIQRYFLRRNNSYAGFKQFNFTLNDDNDFISLPASYYETTVYRITGDKTYETAPFSYTKREKRLYYNDINSVDWWLPSDNPKLPITFRGDIYGQPTDQQLINGYISFYPTGNSNVYAYTSFDYWMSYYTMNNDTNYNSYKNSYLTAPNQQNIYNNEYFQNTTQVTNNNADSLYAGAFAPIFNVDLTNIDLPDLAPSITAGLQPTLQLGIDDLLDALMDFFGNMPDIGLTWDSDTTNNYYEIIPDDNQPPDNPPTTGDINITVDITRPDVDAPDTSPNVSIYVPTVTTTSLPPSVIQAGAKFLEVGKDMTDMIGITSTIVWLGLAGVGVMLVFKEW